MSRSQERGLRRGEDRRASQESQRRRHWRRRAPLACVAAIAGATALMAVTPHIEVPHASKAPRRGAKPARAARAGIIVTPAPTERAAAVRVVQPSRAPVPQVQFGANAYDAGAKHRRRSEFEPGFNRFYDSRRCSVGCACASTMETGMAEMCRFDGRADATMVAAPAVAAAAARPGARERSAASMTCGAWWGAQFVRLGDDFLPLFGVGRWSRPR